MTWIRRGSPRIALALLAAALLASSAHAANWAEIPSEHDGGHHRDRVPGRRPLLVRRPAPAESSGASAGPSRRRDSSPERPSRTSSSRTAGRSASPSARTGPSCAAPTGATPGCSSPASAGGSPSSPNNCGVDCRSATSTASASPAIRARGCSPAARRCSARRTARPRRTSARRRLGVDQQAPPQPAASAATSTTPSRSRAARDLLRRQVVRADLLLVERADVDRHPQSRLRRQRLRGDAAPRRRPEQLEPHVVGRAQRRRRLVLRPHDRRLEQRARLDVANSELGDLTRGESVDYNGGTVLAAGSAGMILNSIDGASFYLAPAAGASRRRTGRASALPTRTTRRSAGRAASC